MTAILTALREMRGHPMRTALTTTGIAIAVASVVVVAALLTGAARMFETALYDASGASIASARVITRLGRASAAFAELHADFRDGDSLYAVRALHPIVSAASLTTVMSAHIVTAGSEAEAVLRGVEASYLSFARHELKAGRLLTAYDVATGATVCVVRPPASEAEPLEMLGREVQINGVRARVVGVVEGQSIGSESYEVFVPMSACRARFEGCGSSPKTLALRVRRGVSGDVVKAGVIRAFRFRVAARGGGDIDVRTADSVLRKQRMLLGVVGVIFGTVSLICLTVGGVGLMNVLLAGVTERSREIGVRRAVGARRSDIYVQFAVEALALSAVGCVIGSAGGALITAALGGIINGLLARQPLGLTFEPGVSFVVGVIAVVGSTVVGLVFGTYPALVAARRDPVDALRAE